MLKVLDGYDLSWSETLLIQWRHVSNSSLDRGSRMIDFVTQPLGQGLRSGECKDIRAGRIRFQQVGESRFYPRALVAERQRTAWGRQRLRQSLAVLGGLDLEANER